MRFKYAKRRSCYTGTKDASNHSHMPIVNMFKFIHSTPTPHHTTAYLGDLRQQPLQRLHADLRIGAQDLEHRVDLVHGRLRHLAVAIRQQRAARPEHLADGAAHAASVASAPDSARRLCADASHTGRFVDNVV